jgi:hypothetical protein
MRQKPSLTSSFASRNGIGSSGEGEHVNDAGKDFSEFGHRVSVVLSYADGCSFSCSRKPQDRSRMERKSRLLWGMAAIGLIFSLGGRRSRRTRQGMNCVKPSSTFRMVSVRRASAASGSLVDGWAPRRTASSRSSRSQSGPVSAGQPLWRSRGEAGRGDARGQDRWGTLNNKSDGCTNSVSWIGCWSVADAGCRRGCRLGTGVGVHGRDRRVVSW